MCCFWKAIFFFAAEVREIHFKKKLLIESLKLQISCCSPTESCLLSQRRFLILYHSKQMKEKKKNKSEVDTDSLN